MLSLSQVLDHEVPWGRTIYSMAFRTHLIHILSLVLFYNVSYLSLDKISIFSDGLQITHLARLLFPQEIVDRTQGNP